MAGLKLYPEEVEKQCNDMISALETNKSTLSAVETNVEDFVTNDSLTGDAWAAMKTQVGNHQYAIRALILAEEAIISDCRSLSASVGSETLIEKDLQEQISHLEAANNSLEATSMLFESMLNQASYLSTDAVSGIRSTINNTYNLMAQNSHKIIVLKEKLNLLYYINNSTQTLFSGSDGELQLVKSIVSELGKAWDVEKGSFSPVSLTNDQLAKINKIWMKKYIASAKEAGIELTESRAKELMELGYTEEKIRDMMSRCETTSDTHFLTCLLIGDYDAAFRICPFKQWEKNGEPGLSDPIKILMAEFAVRLYEEALEKDCDAWAFENEKKERKQLFRESSYKELTDFTNAIYTDKYVSRSPCNTNLFPPESCTSEYLKYLYEGTDVNLYAQALALRSKDFDQFRLKEMSTTQYANMIMEGYWASQSQLHKKHEDQKNIPEVEVSGIIYNFESHTMSMQVNYGSKNKHIVETTLLERPSDMDDAHTSDDLKELRQKAEELKKTALFNGATNTGLAMLSVIAPEIGTPLAVLKEIAEGSFSENGEKAYEGIKTAYDVGDDHDDMVGHSLSAVEEFINYYSEKSEIEQQEKKIKNDYIDRKFGAGVRIAVDGNKEIVARGIIDPQEAYLFGRWEREGIRAFVDIEKQKCDEIEQRIDEISKDPYKNIDSNTVKNMKVLLRGGGAGSIEEIDSNTYLVFNDVMRECLSDESFCVSDAYKDGLKSK